MNWYRIKTAFIGLKRLATLPEEDKQACIDAYKFFQRMQAGEKTETEAETKAVEDYYKVLNNLLSVFVVEKLYIPPQLDESEGLYGNQLLIEQFVLKELNLESPGKSHLLDMGCGRGRISYQAPPGCGMKPSQGRLQGQTRQESLQKLPVARPHQL